MSDYIPPNLKNSSELNGYDRARSSIDYSKTKVLDDYTSTITGERKIKVQFFDKTGKEVLIWDHKENSLGYVAYGRAHGLTGLYPNSDTFYYTGSDGNGMMIYDYDGDHTIDRTYNAEIKESKILNEPSHPVCDFIAKNFLRHILSW